MAFSKAPRKNFFDEEVRKRQNLPGPGSYSNDTKWKTNGFKYHDLTASTICMSNTILDRSCDDIDLHKRNTASTPLKRNALTSSVRGSKSSRKALNMDRTQAKEEATKARYEEELRRREIKYMEMHNDSEALKNTVETLKQMVKTLEQEMKDKADTVTKKKSEIEQLKKTIAELEAQVKDQQWNIESLESKCKQLTDKDNKSYQQNLVLEEKILGYMNRIESDEKKSKELQLSIEDLQKLLQDKAKIVESAQLELYNMRQEKQEKETNVESMIAEMKQSYEFQLAEEVTKIKELKFKLQQLETQINTSKLDNEHLRAEMDNFSYQSAEQSTTISSYREANAKLESEIESQKADMAQLLTKHTEEMNRSRNELETKKTEIQNAEEQLKSLKDQLNSVTNSEASRTEENVLFKETIKQLENKLEELSTSHATTLEEFSTSKIKVADLEKEIEQLTKLQVAASEENANNKQTIEQLKSEADNLTDSTAKLTEENVCYKQTISQLKSQVENLTSSLVSLSDENTSYKQTISQLERHVENLTVSESRSKELAKENTDLQAKIKTLNDKLIAEKNKAQSSIKSMKTKMDECKNAGKYYQDKSHKQNEQLEKQKSIIAQIKQELTATSKQNGEVEQLKSELAAEKESTDKLQTKIQSLMGDLSKLRAESNQEKVAKCANDKLRFEIENLELRVSSLTMSEDTWKSRFEELNEYVTPFRQDLAKYAEEANHMHGENSKKAKELAELHCQLATNMGHQNQKQKIKYMTKIKQELQETKEKLSGKECELKKAKRQIEALTDDINAVKGIKRFDPKKAFQKV